MPARFAVWAPVALLGLQACEIFDPLGHLQDHHADPPACKPGSQSTTVLGDAVAISAQGDHTCALRHDGSVACWGANSAGGNGDPTSPFDRSPYVAIASDFGSGNATAVAAGNGTGYAEIASATPSLYAWGSDGDGQAGPLGPGQGASDPNPTPRPIPTMPPPSSVLFSPGSLLAAGRNFVCATDQASAVWCWGADDYGNVGPMPGVFGVPGPVAGADGAYALALGDWHACAALDSSLVCWGLDQGEQLGGPLQSSACGSSSCSPQPVQVPLMGPDFSVAQPIASLAGGANHTCMVDHAGVLECWGDYSAGQTGDVSPSVIPEPAAIVHRVMHLPAGKTSAAVAAGGNTTCVVENDGSVYCFGANPRGQLGSPPDVLEAGAVAPPHDVPQQVAGLSGVTALAVGANHACAIEGCGSGGGVVLCWGANDVGQLGNGTTDDSSAPGVVLAPLQP